MDTRRSRANLDSKKASPKGSPAKGISLKRGNMEATSDNTEDSSDDSKPNARVLRSKGKTSVKDSDSRPKKGIDAKKQSPPSASPPPSKKRRTTDPLSVKEESKPKTPESHLDEEETKEEIRSLADEEDIKETIDLSDKDYEEELESEDDDDADSEDDDAQSAEGSSPSKLSSGKVSQAKSSSSLQKSSGNKEESNKDDPTLLKPVTVFKSQFPAKPVTVAKNENTGSTKPITIQVKKVVKGSEDGEIQVLTTYEEHNGNKDSQETDDGPSKTKWLTTTEKVHRTYSGPVKKVNSTTVTKTGGRKYMILDKATIKGMMDKGLIQAIGKANKEGGNQQPVTYKAILPKAGPSILRRIGAPTFRNDGALSTSPGKSSSQDVNASSQNVGSGKFPTTVISTSTMASTSGSFKAIASIPSKLPATSSVSQVITSPVFVKTQMVSSGSNPGGLNLVALPSNILNQMQKTGTLFSTSVNNSATGNKVIFQNAPTTNKGNIVVSTSTVTGSKSSVMTSNNDVEIIDDVDDPEYCPSVELSDSSGPDEAPRDDAKYGVPTGVCKVLKSMKMYQYVDKPKDISRGMNMKYVSNGPKNGNNIRWVAVPNKPGEPRPDGGPKLQRCAPPVLPLSVPPTEKPAVEEKPPEEEIVVRNVRLLPECSDEFFGHHKIKDLRVKQKEQLVYHRKRYSELLQTYNELASKYDEIKDVGTMKQILTDSKKFMKKDHIQFFRNEMMLRDRSGTGHRYSPKFMTMLMKYYNRSPIGYRFLRQIFTLPAVRTLLNWQSKSLHMRKKKSKKVKDHLEITVDGTKLPSQANEVQRYDVTKMPFESDSEYDSEVEEDEVEQDTGNGNTKANNTLSTSANTDIVIEFAEQ